MAKRKFVFALLFLMLTVITYAQQVFKTTPTSVIPYLEYLPQDYNSNSDKYPLVFFMHGIGERGPNTTDLTQLEAAIWNVAKHGPPQYVQQGTQFPFILISPQLKNNNGTWPMSYIMEVINYCRTYLRIDERRIIVTGLSLGGGGAWTAAQTYPELFAAAAPVCGGYNSPSEACNIAGENLPVWAFHGDVDTTVPYSKTVTMVNAINACIPTPSPLAKVTIYHNVAHNAWDYAFRPDHSLHNPNVYEWMMSFTNVTNKGNKIPLANAGADKTMITTSTTLTGGGIDTDGSIASYVWTKLQGQGGVLTNANTSSLSVSGLSIGNYVFKLKVTDNSGNVDCDYVKVSVVPNAAPVANAGTDQTITIPVSNATMSGSGADSDGSISTYLWAQTAGPSATLTATNTASIVASNLTAGTYHFRLTVTDNYGATNSDDVVLTVNPPIIPVVSAGADKLVKLPTTSATISGSASDGGGGSIVSYLWTKISGPSCIMTATTNTSLKLSGLISGQYIFRLTAKDNDGYSSYDEMILNVDAPPAVNAGANQTVSLPMSAALILNGGATDADGTIVKYLWSKYSGPNITAENSSSSSFKITKMYEGTYVFKLAVTDNLGAQGIDYVTVVVTTSSSTTTSSMRMSTETTEILEAPALQSAWETGNVQIDIPKGNTVAVFNGSGEKIYAGDWSEEKSNEVLVDGLYIVHEMKDGVRIRSSKILKKAF
jgi:dienelactone hydrolase